MITIDGTAITTKKLFSLSAEMSTKALVLAYLISVVVLEQLPEILQSVQSLEDFRTILFLYSEKVSAEIQEILVMEHVPVITINLMDHIYFFNQREDTQDYGYYPLPAKKSQTFNHSPIPVMKFYSQTSFFIIIDVVESPKEDHLLIIEKLLTFKKDVKIVVIVSEMSDLL